MSKTIVVTRSVKTNLAWVLWDEFLPHQNCLIRNYHYQRGVLTIRWMYDQLNMKSESFEVIILKSYLNALILKGNLVTRTLKKENEHFYGNEWTRKWWEKHKNFLEYYFVKYVRDESIVFRRKHIPRAHFEAITRHSNYPATWARPKIT